LNINKEIGERILGCVNQAVIVTDNFKELLKLLKSS